jgi:O-antigen/teichoic acid export membrane protein
LLDIVAGQWAARLIGTTQCWLGRQQHPVWQKLDRHVRSLRHRIDASAFGRRTLIMLIGTTAGQTVSVLLSLLLTRLYTPEQFGQLGVFVSIITIAAVLGALCYEIAIPTARSPTEAADMLALCMVALLLTTTALSIATICIPESGLALLGLSTPHYVRILVPLGFAFLGAYHLMLYYAIWAQDFRSISHTRISQGLSGPLSQIALGVLNFGAVGLCCGFIIGQSSGTLLLFNRLVLQRLAAMRDISIHGVLRTAWRNRAFPLISSWATMIDSAGSGQIAYILVAAFYPGPLAGFMFISERVVGRPLMMLSTSMLSVYMAEIGQTATTDPARLRRRFLQVILRQTVFGAAWVVAVDVGAVLLFPLFFGADWADAVPYLLVLSVAYLTINVVTAVGHTLQVLGRQAIAATWQVGRVLAVIAGFALSAHYHMAAFYAILLYAFIQTAACAVLLAIMSLSIERLQVPLEVRTA